MLDNIIKAKTLLYNRNDKNQDFIKDEKQIIKCNLCFSIINKHDISNEFAAMEFEYNYIVDLNDNEVDEKDRVLYFCFQCCDNCFICECGKVYDDGDEIYYLLKNYKKLDKCITCRLEEKEESHNEMEKILDSIGCGDKYDDFIKFIRFLYEHKEDFFNYIKYKKEFHDFLHNKNNDKEIKMESINIKESNEYKDLEKINEKNNIRISELEEKLSKLDSNIEDNVLFKKLKEQNSLLIKNNENLESELKEIKQNFNSNANISDIKDNNINIDDKINKALEKQKTTLYNDFSIKIENIKNDNKILLDSIREKDKVINDLQSKLNNKRIKKDKKIENNENKFGIFVFDTMEEDWKKFISSFTYKDILRMLKLDEFINNDSNINKEDYKEVYEWLNIYELDEKKIKSNYNIKRKIKRCKIIYEKYPKQLKYIKFNVNNLSYMKNKEFDDFLNILDEKIKQIKIPNNDLEDISDNILNINTKIKENIKDSKTNTKKCGNYGHGCYNEVIDRTYCQECMDDGYFTTDNESD